MKHRNWIALAAAMGIALAGCSSMKSADNSSGNGESTNSTMRRADAGTTNDAGSTSQPNTDGSNTSSSTSSSSRNVDCTDDANAQNPACANQSSQSTRPEPDATTPNTPPQQ